MIRTTLRRMTKGRWPRVRAGEQLSCPEVGLLMQRFVDGEIEDDVEVQAMIAHLDKCEPCGFETDVYRKIKAALEHHRTPVGDETLQRLREFGQRLVEG